jgi:hypothetical protein
MQGLDLGIAAKAFVVVEDERGKGDLRLPSFREVFQTGDAKSVEPTESS